MFYILLNSFKTILFTENLTYLIIYSVMYLISSGKNILSIEYLIIIALIKSISN